MRVARRTAWEILNRVETLGQYSNLALDSAIRRGTLCDADRNLLTALVYGVTERKLTLDYQLQTLSNRDMEDISPDIRNLLRLGLYQMAYLDRVPDHAAVDETVALAPRRAKGFVNAVLRAFGRRDKEIRIPDPDEDFLRYLSVKYSFCSKICARFVKEFGEAETEKLLASFFVPPSVTLRVNTLKTDRESYLARLLQAGFCASVTAQSSTGIRISGGASVHSLPGFDAGECFVQDEASQLCVEALDPKPGMTVLDLCACPGSKSFGIAVQMKDCGRVIAGDLHKNKLSLLESGAKRLGLTCITVREGDAREINSEWRNKADRVLCDVPCSGFGVFSKKPELRYKDPDESRRLPEIQREILKTAGGYVKTGGMLVYSTCTLLPQENGENVSAFLREHPQFALSEMRTLTPASDGTDGFFFAVMKKKTED